MSTQIVYLFQKATTRAETEKLSVFNFFARFWSLGHRFWLLVEWWFDAFFCTTCGPGILELFGQEEFLKLN